MIKALLDKYFKAETVQKIIEQTKLPETFAYNKFFASAGSPVLGDSVKIPIKRGASVVLHSVSPEAEHLIHEDKDVYLLSVELPRFPLESIIQASTLNTVKALDTEANQVETLAKIIGDLIKGQKESFITTLEYMSIGALFGKVFDGKGKALFEFSSALTPIEFKGYTIIESLNTIDDALSTELGTTVGYSVIASREFINKLANKATTEGLFKLNQARWIEESGGRRVLEVYSTKFIPYTAHYKNTAGEDKAFLEAGTAIVTPQISEAYKLYYGRANHTQAINRAPTLFFTAAPEALPKGRGYSIVSEMKPIPVCVRPNALIRLAFSD
jgi:hypothetical protein